MSELTKTEQRLLLYIETCAVDGSGLLHSQKINQEEMEILDKWAKAGFIEGGRVSSDYIERGYSQWCKLSKAAWAEAHRLRHERGEKSWVNKHYETTEEKRKRVAEAT